MSNSEPSFVVPLSALVYFSPIAFGAWKCEVYDQASTDCCDEHQEASRAEAESAAIQHLAEVHGLGLAEWKPSRIWTVLDHTGEIWCQTSDEQEAREAWETCPGGGKLYREYRRQESKIVEVDR